MIDIRINGISLDLRQDTKISLTIKTPFFNTSFIPGTWSFPFTIPATDHNLTVLGFPDIIENKDPFKKKIECQLFIGGIHWISGVMNIMPSNSKELKVCILAGAGTIAEVKDKKIKEFNWPEVNIPYTPVRYIIVQPHSFAIVPIDTGSFSGNVNFRFRGTTYTVTTTGTHPDGRFAEAIHLLAAAINANTETNGATAEYAPWEEGMVIVGTGGGTHRPGLKIINDPNGPYANEALAPDNSWSMAVQNTWFIKQSFFGSGTTELLEAFNAIANGTSEENRYVLPLMYNQRFYDDKNSNWGNYINVYDEVYGYSHNTIANPSNKTFVPMFRLRYILDKILTDAGNYQLSGTWVSKIIDKLIFYNNKAIDKLVTVYRMNSHLEDYPGGNVNLNVFANKFQVTDHMPDLSFSEILNGLKNKFAMVYFFDLKNKTITPVPFKEILLNNDYEDWTEGTTPEFEYGLNDTDGFTLSENLDSSDASIEVLDLTKYTLLDPIESADELPEPAEGLAVLVKNENYWYVTEMIQQNPDNEEEGFQDEDIFIAEWVKKSFNLQPYVVDNGKEEIKSIFSTLAFLQNRIAYSEQLGSSPEFGLGKNGFSPRLLIYYGIVSGAPYATCSGKRSDGAKIGEFSLLPEELTADGEDLGLYKQFWEDVLNFRANTRMVTFRKKFSLSEILSLDQMKPKRIGNVNYILDEIRLNVSMDGIEMAEVDLWKK